MTLTIDDIKKLKEPFDQGTIGIKVQSLSKSKTKAMLVCYLQHTDVYDRLESVDPAWDASVVHEEWRERPDLRGNLELMCFARVRLTVKGVTRENYGEGGDPKAAVSDAIKRAAMLFGVGRYLYDSEQVWVDYNEEQDKYHRWTLEEYQSALKRGQNRLPVAPEPTISVKQGEDLAELGKSKGVTTGEIARRAGVSRLGEITVSQFQGLWDRLDAYQPETADGPDLAKVAEDVLTAGIPKDLDHRNATVQEALIRMGVTSDAIDRYCQTLPFIADFPAVVAHLEALVKNYTKEAILTKFAPEPVAKTTRKPKAA